MNKAQYENARQMWLSHRAGCDACQRYLDGHTGSLRHLCWRGTQLFLAWQEARQSNLKERHARQVRG